MASKKRHAAEHAVIVADQFEETLVAPLIAGIKTEPGDLVQSHRANEVITHSVTAQGGMQASLANVIKGQGDNEDIHFKDTVRGSDWGRPTGR